MGYGSPAWNDDATPSGMVRTARSYRRPDAPVRASMFARSLDSTSPARRRIDSLPTGTSFPPPYARVGPGARDGMAKSAGSDPTVGCSDHGTAVGVLRVISPAELPGPAR